MGHQAEAVRVASRLTGRRRRRRGPKFNLAPAFPNSLHSRVWALFFPRWGLPQSVEMGEKDGGKCRQQIEIKFLCVELSDGQ